MPKSKGSLKKGLTLSGVNLRGNTPRGDTLREVGSVDFHEVEEQVQLGQNTCEKESEMKERCGNPKEGAMEVSQDSDVAKKSSLKMYTSVLSSPPMLLLFLALFLYHLGIFSFYSLSTDRVIKFGGLSKAESSLLLSIIGVSSCLGRVVFGQLLDRWKQHFFMNTIVMFLIISGFVHGHFS